MTPRKYVLKTADVSRCLPIILVILWGLWLYWQWPSPISFPAELHEAIPIEGWVSSFPKQGHRSTRFEFTIDAPEGTPAATLDGQQVRLSWWNNQPDIRVGDRLALTVRLKPPRGRHNPGAFDYEQWLFARRIVAIGTVRAYPAPRLIARANRYPIDQWRQTIAESFLRQLPDNPHVGILIALAVGEASHISAWQWDVFRNTGVVHMISVSGTHITLVTALTWAITRGLLHLMAALFPNALLHWPIRRVALLCALITASGYTILSGWSVPAQRALWMATAIILGAWRKKPLGTRQLLPIALIILMWEPTAILTVGFWLSFSAIAVILYVSAGQQRGQDWLVSAFRVQISVSLALAPLTLLFFQTIQWLSPIANFIAIPWMDGTVLPLALLAAVATPFPTIQAYLLEWAALSMEGLWHILSFLSGLPGAGLYWPTPPWWALVFAVWGLLLFMAPRRLPGRWLSVPLCLPMLWPPLPRPHAGAVWFTLLDVGEGLSAVVRTQNHVLVYDTGPKMGDALDAGSAAIVPFLQHQGMMAVDMLVVSHPDAQHTGGVRSLLERLPVQQIFTSDVVKTPINGAQPCRAGQSWTWDGVTFRMLHPAEAGFSADEASCVLHIDSVGGRVLLTGDIETGAEAVLVASADVEGLAAEIVVAPHHGRRNLSTSAFLTAVAPRYVLFSVDPDNRHGYPRPDTVARYQSTGATLLNTADEGAITFTLDPGAPIVLEGYRQD